MMMNAQRKNRSKLSWMRCVATSVPLISDHNESLLAAEKERILIDHGLYDVFQVGAH